MVTVDVYTISSGELIRAFYTAVAGMFQYAGITGLFKTALMLGSLWTVGQFIVRRDLRSLFFFQLKYVVVTAFILTPVCTVHIIDRTNPLEGLVVDKVPLLLGVVGSLSSTLSDRVTQTFELFFHSPNDMEYSQTGMVMGAKLFLSASNIKITDANFNSNMQKFMQQCVFYDLMYGRYSLNDLNQSTHLWDFVKTNASVARGFIYDKEFKSCLEAANLLESLWEAVILDAKSKYAGFAFGNRTDAVANFEKFLPQSYKHLTTLSGEASSIIRQNMMANAIRDGVFSMGARVNSKAAIDSFSASRALEKIPSSLTNVGLMAAYWLPVIQSLLFCVIIGCFLFVLFFFPFPGGLSFLQFYITLYVWLGLWSPMFTIINYGMTMAAQFSLSFASTGTTTLAYQTGINQTYENFAALSGYLTLTCISLSYMLISRSIGSVISAAQQSGGIIQNAATSAADEVQTGNYNYGNTSFANHSGFNTNAFHQDQNARVSLGSIETSLEGGSIARIARNGNESLMMANATSHTPLAIQLGESTRSAFSELSDTALNTAFNQSKASSEQYGASLRSLVELGEAQSHGEQSGEGHQISNSAGFNTAASTVSNLVDNFAHDHNISRDDSIRILTAVGMNANGNLGVGKQSSTLGVGPLGLLRGGVDVGASWRKERDSSHTNQDAHLVNEAQRFSEENHFNDVVNQARQATKDTHFRTSDDVNNRLADNFSTGYDKAMHYREEAMASLVESESYHRQANLSNEQVSSINLDAQTGFIDWLSHHPAPNSQGNIGLQQAEAIIRQDPELAQSYARQFVEEKTHHSISQFQKNNHLNPSHVQHAYDGYKDQINAHEQVDNRLNQYTNTFNQHAKAVNVGRIDKGATRSVDEEFDRSEHEITMRVEGIVNDGSQVMQQVRVTEANKDTKK